MTRISEAIKMESRVKENARTKKRKWSEQYAKVTKHNRGETNYRNPKKHIEY